MCVRVRVRVCVCAFVYARVCVCVGRSVAWFDSHSHTHTHTHTHAHTPVGDEGTSPLVLPLLQTYRDADMASEPGQLEHLGLRAGGRPSDPDSLLVRRVPWELCVCALWLQENKQMHGYIERSSSNKTDHQQISATKINPQKPITPPPLIANQ